MKQSIIHVATGIFSKDSRRRAPSSANTARITRARSRLHLRGDLLHPLIKNDGL
ncbi:MAG: hypothetical protein RRC07_10935 [Anaerolineae bacterium]|nr:hypothetical protein [Anaerolineae bacterium]